MHVLFGVQLFSHLNYFIPGNIRLGRSAKVKCDIVAEIFEGYTPLDDLSNLAVDYIHNC